jgi:hypothetical protein
MLISHVTNVTRISRKYSWFYFEVIAQYLFLLSVNNSGIAFLAVFVSNVETAGISQTSGNTLSLPKIGRAGNVGLNHLRTLTIFVTR